MGKWKIKDEYDVIEFVVCLMAVIILIAYANLFFNPPIHYNSFQNGNTLK